MNIHETRKYNLRHLIGDVSAHGAVSKFARDNNFDPTYIRQILNDHRKMGEKAARKFEKALKLEDGYLDRPIRLQINERAASYDAKPLSEEAIAIALAFEESTPDVQAAALRMLGILREIDKKGRG